MQPKEMNRSKRVMLSWILGTCLAGLLTLPAGAAEPGAVDRIVVEKSQRRMDLMSRSCAAT